VLGQAAVLPPTKYDKAAWILMAAGLLFILYFKLVPALLAGLLVHGLIHKIAVRIENRALTHSRAKIVALALIALVIIGITTALVLLAIAFLRGRFGGVPSLLNHMASVLASLREKLGDSIPWPEGDDLNISVAQGLREHAKELQNVGGEAGRQVVHIIVGVVLGALISFEMKPLTAPLSSSLSTHIRRLADAFDKVVFAQVKISALNTTLTALFLLAALPLFGIHIPLRKTLVGVTFVTGLLPVLGNLISNTIIVIISLGVSPGTAIAALIFLIVIHKLEYFMNAKIVGGEIKASAWEILIAMFAMEAAFGIPGLIMAPILYAYIKGELLERRLI
jgi:predicted PurR-regulated permease PerM